MTQSVMLDHLFLPQYSEVVSWDLWGIIMTYYDMIIIVYHLPAVVVLIDTSLLCLLFVPSLAIPWMMML